MDSNDATILGLALGIPSATLLSIAFLLVLRIQHRQLQAQRIPNPTVPTNSPAPPSPPPDPYYGIPFEQRPPRINAPLPHRPIPLREFDRAARVGGGISSVDSSWRVCAKASYPSQKAHACHHHLPHHICRRSPTHPSISLTWRVCPLQRERQGIQCGPRHTSHRPSHP